MNSYRGMRHLPWDEFIVYDVNRPSYYSSPLTCPLQLHNYHTPPPLPPTQGGPSSTNSQVAIEVLHWLAWQHTQTQRPLPSSSYHMRIGTTKDIHLNPNILTYHPQTCYATNLATTKPKLVTIHYIHRFKSPPLSPFVIFF